MSSKLTESTNFVVLLVLLAITYVVGYALGIGLTGSVILALLLAFGLSCVSMIGIVLLAPFGFDPNSDRSGQ